MDEWEMVFFYDKENDCVCSISNYHAENCDVGSLVEAHPEVIYFYANLVPQKEWDFNEVAWPQYDFGPHGPIPDLPRTFVNDAFNHGSHRESMFIEPERGEN